VYGYLFFDTPLYKAVGLPVNEALGVGELTESGDWLIPTTDAVNMTVHMHGREEPRPALWDDDAVEPDADTTYVSFVVSDGDALGYMQTLARSLQFDHLDEETIPIGISTSPRLAEVAPNIWNWYLDHLPDNARFVAGPSGSAYFFPSYAAEEDLDRFLEMSRTDLDATGLRSSWVINPPLTASPTDDAAAALEQFGPDVVPVAPDRFAGLLRGAAAAGYTGSPDAVAPARPAPGACRADAANIAWDTVPVIAAFLANAMLVGDLAANLAANTTAVGDAVTVDETLLAEAVRSTFQALRRSPSALPRPPEPSSTRRSPDWSSPPAPAGRRPRPAP